MVVLLCAEIRRTIPEKLIYWKIFGIIIMNKKEADGKKGKSTKG